MNTYPIQLGVDQRNIMLAQINEETGQEYVITISVDQAEEVISGLRIAVEALRKQKDNY